MHAGFALKDLLLIIRCFRLAPLVEEHGTTEMEWKFFAQLLMALVVAALGAYTAHYFSARRDLANERRKLRVSYLLEAYRQLESAANQEDNASNKSRLESAIADIQLLGSPRQVSLARQFAYDMSKEKTAPLDELIDDLRHSLREEMELEALSEPVVYLRIGN